MNQTTYDAGRRLKKNETKAKKLALKKTRSQRHAFLSAVGFARRIGDSRLGLLKRDQIAATPPF